MKIRGFSKVSCFSDRKILALIETSETIDDMDLPGSNLHNLKDKRKNTLAVKVSGNWRVTFKLRNGDILEVNYENYHERSLLSVCLI